MRRKRQFRGACRSLRAKLSNVIWRSALILALLPCHGANAGDILDDDAYRQALADLSNGQTRSAIEKLSAVLKRYPSHRGAQLDLALAYCKANLPENAEILFAQMEALPDLPPAIDEVIRLYRRDYCKPSSSAWLAYAAVGVGKANNLNQAPAIGFINLDPLGLILQLSDQSRPQRDHYSTLEVALFRPPADRGWSGGVFMQSINYAQENTYDNALVQGVVSYRDYLGQGRLDIQGALAHQTYNGHSHLTLPSLSAGIMWPLFAADEHQEAPVWQAGGVVSAFDFRYPDLPNYRSRQFEFRGRLRYQPNLKLSISSEAGWSVDKALADRPGGDREGPIAQLALQWILDKNQSLELLHRRTWLQDAQAYSPVFFGDTQRSNGQSSWYGAWRYWLSPQFQLRIEGRYWTSRDTVPLFNFNSSSAGVMVEWWPR